MVQDQVQNPGNMRTGLDNLLHECGLQSNFGDFLVNHNDNNLFLAPVDIDT